jgi:uncharacterized protein YkvS
MSNEQKEKKMTQAEKITNLIEIADKLTTRCMKIEKDSIQQIFALEKRIAHLENKRDKEQESHDNNTSYKTYENEDDMLDNLSRPWKK